MLANILTKKYKECIEVITLKEAVDYCKSTAVFNKGEIVEFMCGMFEDSLHKDFEVTYKNSGEFLYKFANSNMADFYKKHKLI